MKLLFLLFFLSLTTPAWAANSGAGAAASAPTEKKADAAVKSADTKEEPVKKENPNEFSCPFYKVVLPTGWRAIRAPEERQGLVNAIFAKNPASPIITIIVGPREGADPQLIANMFADQFKAPKAPSMKNGQFYFSFPQMDPTSHAQVTANACIGIDGDYFMLTTYIGNQKEVQNFFKNCISSEEYHNLIPK